MRSGSWAASSTFPTTVWIGIFQLAKNKAALIWEGEPGEQRTLTYQQLHSEVCRFANVLKHAGVATGDRVALYMPLIPELAIAMLACARIGATHSVIFGGFSSAALIDRINDATCKVVVTADGGWRRGGEVKLKAAVDEALKQTPSVKSCIVVRRTAGAVDMKAGRDFWWHEPWKPLTEPATRRVRQRTSLFILYTSAPRKTKAICTRQRVISYKHTSQPNGSLILKTKTFTGAPPTSAG